jgi:hypothetical protein
LELAKWLKEKGTGIVRKMNRARWEIAYFEKFGKDELYSIKLLKNKECGSTLTIYQGKKKKIKGYNS